MKHLLTAAVNGVATVTIAAVRLLVVLMLMVLTIQVFMRSVLDQPPSWSEELALLAFSWAVLLGIAWGVREGIHVRMDILLEVLPPVLCRILERIVMALVTAIGMFLLYSGWNYTISSVGTTSAAISYPMPLLYASAVVCGFLIAVFGIEGLVLVGHERKPSLENLA